MTPRPRRWLASPPSSRTRRCFKTACREMPKRAAIVIAVCSLSTSKSSNIARRVGSASVLKTRSEDLVNLTLCGRPCLFEVFRCRPLSRCMYIIRPPRPKTRSTGTLTSGESSVNPHQCRGRHVSRDGGGRHPTAASPAVLWTGSRLFNLRHAEDDIAVALAGMAQGVEAVERAAFQPDEAMIRAFRLVADAAEREHGDDSVVVLLQRG